MIREHETRPAAKEVNLSRFSIGIDDNDRCIHRAMHVGQRAGKVARKSDPSS
jgi:hypothetical protein